MSEPFGTAVFGMNVSESYQKSRQERGDLLVLGAGCSFTIRDIPLLHKKSMEYRFQKFHISGTKKF